MRVKVLDGKIQYFLLEEGVGNTKDTSEQNGISTLWKMFVHVLLFWTKKR